MNLITLILLYLFSAWKLGQKSSQALEDKSENFLSNYVSHKVMSLYVKIQLKRAIIQTPKS